MAVSARDRRNEEFEEFVRLAGTPLLRAGFLLTGDQATAEDLVQTTLLRTFVHWKKARQAPKAYANQILLNLVRDRWRQLARRRLRAGLTADEGSVDASDQAEGPINQYVERDAMLRALNALPDRQRDVLVLRFYLDQTVAETATILGIPEGTVKSTVSRAVERLRGLLEPDDSDEPSEVPDAH
jgi:RNA polymerase sigma-70 factor (sigma-E family)